MQDVNELKNLVIQSFEAKGMLSQLRAQIKASVFKAIEDEEGKPSNVNKSDAFQWENSSALGIKDDEELTILCKLFKNLLGFYDLDYTLNVFKHEVNDKEDEREKELLLKIGIDVKDTSRPYIFQLLEREEVSETIEKNNNINKGHEPIVNERRDPEPFKKSAKTEEKSPVANNPVPKNEVVKQEPKKEEKASDFLIQRPPEKVPNIKEQIANTESEIKLTEEQQDDENDMFLSDSIGIDLTVDSEALKQFDYDESLEDLE